MDDSGIGQAILYYRMKNHFSQAQVCEGICSVMTLSRIENESREYDFFVMESLLGRLGKNIDVFEFALGEEEYAQAERRRSIKVCLEGNLLEAAEQKLEEFHDEMPEDSPLHMQFYLLYEAMLQKKKGGEADEIRGLLKRAINCTRPDFAEKSEQIKLFGTVEVKIIYELFLYEHYGMEKLEPLLEYMDKCYDIGEKEKSMVPFFYMLACRFEEEQRYEEMVSCAERAIDIICRGRSYRYLTDLHFLRVKGMEQIYHGTERWTEKAHELAETCKSLYYMCMIEERPDMMEAAERFAAEKLKCPVA